MGPSGSGKSTLLQLIGGLDEPSSGEVLVMGHNLKTMSDDARAEFRNNHIGFVFQFFHLQSYYTVLENVMSPFLFEDSPAPQISTEHYARAKEAIMRVGLSDRWNHIPDELSGGERQRAAIARAIVKNPKIILADEPTGNLDRVTGTAIMELFKTLQKESGVTIVLVTHDERSAGFAERILSLDKGTLL
jgi:ABC-type lipoprotein export system ATPase subunit